MGLSVHSGEEYLSFGALVRDFVSSVGLEAYDSKRKGDCSLFVFRFQVTGSDFLLHIEINDDSNCHPILQKGVFLRSIGHGSEKCFLGASPKPPFISLSSSATILWCVLQQLAYVPPISKTPGASMKLANSSSP